MSAKSEELYDKALDLIQEGKVAEGIAAIEESLMEDPEDGLSWRLYSVTLTAVGRAEDAATAMEKAEKFGVGDVQQFLMKAAQAQVAGNLDAAISRYEDALEVDENRFEVWAAYALALLEAGYRDDALEASEKAVELGDDVGQTWYARGRVLRLTGSIPEALDAYDRAVGFDGKLGIAWHERGMVQVALNDAKGAVESFGKVLELTPGDPAATQALAIAKAKAEES